MRDAIRSVDAANKARMRRQYSPGCSIMLVEGPDDKKLFAKFVDASACHIVIAHGRDHVDGALQILEAGGFVGALGIIDMDFGFLEHGVIVKQNRVYTDTHDVETMIIKSPALEAVLTELGTDSALEAFASKEGCSPRESLLRRGKVLGYLRWASIRESWSFRFEGLAIDDIISEKDLTLDEFALIRVLENRSGQGRIDIDAVGAKVRALESVGHDLWHVCCGHDLVGILSLALRRLWGNNNPADILPTRLERSLRLAYDRTSFAATALCAAIISWEKENAPFVVLEASIRTIASQ